MTATNYKKRKQKGLTQKDKQAKIEHDKWLKKMGVHPDLQLAEKKAKRGNVKTVDPDYSATVPNNIRTSDNILAEAIQRTTSLQWRATTTRCCYYAQKQHGSCVC